jgi:hypothetical protein
MLELKMISRIYFTISGETGRAIFGKSVITPLDFDDQYLNVKGTFLERIEGMTLL